jgi:host factor-I protein
MDNKPAQNIQDTFLNTARKERSSVTIYLVSGVKLTGRIRSFDKYSVILESSNQEQLIFKHAISTVAMGRPLHAHLERPVQASAASASAGGSTESPSSAAVPTHEG